MTQGQVELKDGNEQAGGNWGADQPQTRTHVPSQPEASAQTEAIDFGAAPHSVTMYKRESDDPQIDSRRQSLQHGPQAVREAVLGRGGGGHTEGIVGVVTGQAMDPTCDQDQDGSGDDITPLAQRPVGSRVASSGTASATGSSARRYSFEKHADTGSASSGSVADPSDHVFPIRSVVHVDRTAGASTSYALPRSADEPAYFPRPGNTWDGRRRASNPRVLADVDLSANGRPGRAPNASSLSLSAMNISPDRDRARKRNNLRSSPHGSPITPSMLIFSDTASDASGSGEMGSVKTGSVKTGSVKTDSVKTGSTVPDGAPEDGDGMASTELDETLMSTRFTHVLTKEGHAVITGRDGSLQRCEDEPIHAPGAIQGFGLLVALKEVDGMLQVRIVSENSERIIGYTPQKLFALASFTDIFSESQADNLLDHVDFIRDDDADVITNGPEVFGISMRHPSTRKSVRLWCALHINASHPDLIICEFELEDDRDYPPQPPSEDTVLAEDTLYQNPGLDELNESTSISSKPLRVLRSARKQRGEVGAMQVFDIMSQIQGQLAAAPNLERFLKILVGIVKELTGFHRVMIYQFDSAFNGKVVTELVDPVHTKDLYKGLHFPASDIPKQARDLYKLNKIRLLYDRDLETARLVCRTMEDVETPLDLSHSYLRAMSPLHIKYLANMAVRASMSISVNAFNELWGLIACHTYGSKGMRVAFPIRKMCRLVGDTASRNIERLSYASRLQARKLINTAPTDANPSGYIIASSDDLLKLFDADFGMLSIKGETKMLGKVHQSQEALAMLEYLRVMKFTSVLTSQDITMDFPDLRYPPGFAVIAGFLYVPLSSGGQDFIVFFRKGQTQSVKWAGNPYEKVAREGTASLLEPRKSFQVWHETIVGKCREWAEDQIETAAVLCLVYGKFIEVWRQKEAALQNSRFTRLLLANSAHEVRTPLNAIINYLEIALEGSLDAETRDNLAKSHSASRSLIYVINDLLDLTKTEEGQELIKDEILDLPACLLEATDPFRADAKRKSVGYEVVTHPGVPKYVHGDHRRVRQAIVNLAANAIQHTSEGSIRIECYVAELIETRVKVEITVQDTGRGMSGDQLDALFQDLEQVTLYDEDSKSLVDKDGQAEAKPVEDRSLGLGLAVVARIVRNMDGQLRLKSEEGKGSRFVIQLPFELPANDVTDSRVDCNDTKTVSAAQPSVPSVRKSLPQKEAGELVLVHPSPPSSVTTPTRAHSSSLGKRASGDVQSMTSFNSAKTTSSRDTASSGRSDADRLIDAIQLPLAIGSAAADEIGRQAKAIKGSQRSRHSSPQRLSRPVRRNSSAASMHEVPPAVNGMSFVAAKKTPLKAVRMPDVFANHPPHIPEPSSGTVYELLPSPPPPDAGGKLSGNARTGPHSGGKLRVLIAEDDPVNMKILTKRLEKAGHNVSRAVNGQECAAEYNAHSADFDVVLMDMQMPIVDGLTSAKMIRDMEKSDECLLSPLSAHQGRVPVFAVSASLLEREKRLYVEAGFDGWILKPVDFKRLNTLLTGISDDATRNDCLYVPGQWERGGWFACRTVPPARSPASGTQGKQTPG